MKLAFAISLSAFLLAGFAVAQQNGPTVTMMPINPVHMTAGRSANVELTFRVGNGFHINSNKPNSDLLVPTTLRLNMPAQLVATIDYPAGKQMTFEFSPNEKLSVYSGDFTINAKLRSGRSVSPGTFRIHGDLKYQACNDRQCFPPRTQAIDFDVKIARARRSRRR